MKVTQFYSPPVSQSVLSCVESFVRMSLAMERIEWVDERMETKWVREVEAGELRVSCVMGCRSPSPPDFVDRLKKHFLAQQYTQIPSTTRTRRVSLSKDEDFFFSHEVCV